MKTIDIFRIMACSAAISLAAACYDDAPVWDEFDQVRNEMGQLASRIEALEKSVAEDVAALQSMISVGSIASWTYNAETGKGVITLVDGKQITINQQIKGYSIITVEKGDDGVYYWAICRDGANIPLMVDNKKVPVTVTPALKISADNIWMISVDGGKTWVDTGISYYAENTDEDTEEEPEVEIPEVVLFEKVEVDGDYLLLTLVGGTEVKVSIVGEAVFQASADTLWFSRGGLEKSVAVEMQNVKAYTITEKPEGWKTVFDESYLFVTSPSNFTDYPAEGTVKIFVVFDNGALPDILQLEVAYEPMLSLSRANGIVSVKLSEHTADDFTGYVLTGWLKNEYSPEAVVEKLNAEHESLAVLTGSQVYNLADIIEGFDKTKEYIVAAVPYLPATQVTQGAMRYEVSDIVSIETIAEEGDWKISNLRYDNADLKALMDVPEYYGGFMSMDEWVNRGRADILEMLNAGNLVPVDFVKYEGPANAFPDGEVSEDLNPATEYVVWYMPVMESGEYTEDMYKEYTFTTPDIIYDPSIASPSYAVKEVTASGFMAEVTPEGDFHKTYTAILKSTVLPETDDEIVRYLIDVNHYTSGTDVNTVTTGAFDASDEVYLLAVSVNENGGYGPIVKEQVALKQLVFTEDLGVTVTSVEFDAVGNATLTLSFTGSPTTITYMAAAYTYFTDDVLQSMMAKQQYGEAATVEVSKIGNKITLTGLSVGSEYTFYALVTDSNDNHSYLYSTYTFVPSIQVPYVLSSDSDYEYGMPVLSGKLTGSKFPKTYELKVEMPSDCTRYWLFCGDPEYMTGDEYTDTDKMASMGFDLLGELELSGSTTLTFEIRYALTRIYMVWQDDQGRLHTVYEINPNKK